MPITAMTEIHDLDIDDRFDEKTFQLELQVADPERRALAAGVLHDLIPDLLTYPAAELSGFGAATA